MKSGMVREIRGEWHMAAGMIKKMCAVMALMLAAQAPSAAAADPADKTVSAAREMAAVSESGENAAQADDLTQPTGTYLSFYDQATNKERPRESIRLTADRAVSQVPGSPLWEAQGKAGVVLDEQNGWAEWSFQVPQTGLYSLQVDYYPLDGTGMDISLGFLIDGGYPYEEAQTVSLSRLWKDDLVPGEGFETGVWGDDLRPDQIENRRWNEVWLEDPLGMYEEPYLIRLTAGMHTLRLQRKTEAAAIAGVTVGQPEDVPTYAEYREQRQQLPVGKKTVVQRQEAEYPIEKNKASLYATYDNADPATQPNDPRYVRLNTIGQSNWQTNGEAVSWEADVPESGWYALSFRVRQSDLPGTETFRTLTINGTVPFQEAQFLSFSYARSWYIYTAGGDEPYLFYLDPGDVITLTATTGPACGVLREISRCVNDYNSLFRQILVVVGSQPDLYRDYSLEREIPGLTDELQILLTRSRGLLATMEELYVKENAQTTAIKKMIELLERFVDDCESIPAQFDNFKGHIDNVASVIHLLNEQPLEMDCLYYTANYDSDIPAGVSFWQALKFHVQRFLNSFCADYTNVGKDSAHKTVRVWATTGRDQAEVLDRLISDEFSKISDATIELSLVDTGDGLIKATLAGRGPDAALMLPMDSPIDFALRGANVDLSADTYGLDEELKAQFYPSAFKPFEYQNGLYALPETQSFYMMFYREDVLEELGVKPPDIWEEFYQALKVLQKMNFEVGILEASSSGSTATSNQAIGVSSSLPVFDAFLFQNGGTYYTEDLSSTAFDTPMAREAFGDWVALYRTYRLERSFDFYNRFRSGEMPLGLTSYTMYNQLMAAAPYIRGLWKMAPIPGTPQPDGTVNRAISSVVTGCMMMQAAVDRGVDQETFDFLTWWVSAPVQARFGLQIETVLGYAGRYSPANTAAFEEIPWSPDEAVLLKQQWRQIQNINQVPGNYVVGRSLTNALRKSIDAAQEPQQMLSLYNVAIQEEMTRKRKEFRLE